MTQFKTTLIATAAAIGLLATPAIAQIDMGKDISVSSVADSMTTAAKREAMKNMTLKQKAALLVAAPESERMELLKDLTADEQASVKSMMMDKAADMVGVKSPVMKDGVQVPVMEKGDMVTDVMNSGAVNSGALDGTMDTGIMDPRDMTGVVKTDGSVSMDTGGSVSINTGVVVDTPMTQPMPAKMGTTVSSGAAIMSGTVDTGTLGTNTMTTTTTTTSMPMQGAVVMMDPAPVQMSLSANDTTRMMSPGERLSAEKSILMGMSKTERMNYVKMSPDSRKAMMDSAVMSQWNSGSMSTGMMGSMETSQSMGGMSTSTSTMVKADNPMGITCPEGTVPQADGTCMMR